MKTERDQGQYAASFGRTKTERNHEPDITASPMTKRERQEKVRQTVLNRMDMGQEYTDDQIYEIIAQQVSLENQNSALSIRERVEMEENIFNSLRRMDVLQKLIDDPAITEIMVNGPEDIFYEKEGRICRFDGAFSSEDKLRDIIQMIVGKHNRVVNQLSPIVDTRLPDGSRVNIVLSPISIDGSALSIRKFPETPMTMEELIRIGSLTEEAAEFLRILVQARYSIFISGGTGSGKTTFLNALSQYIPVDERIITIEDSAELQLLDAQNLVRLETRNANLEGVKPIMIRDLIRTALRMRPDRIIVGECRGEEALDMLTAMNTGHDGSLSTGHANSCRDIISRLETMVIMGKDLPLPAIRSQIASGIDIIVQLGRLRDKSRRVLEIAELDGMENGEVKLHILFRFRETEGENAENFRKEEEKSRLCSGENDNRLNHAEGKLNHVEGKLIHEGELLHREKLAAAGLAGALHGL